MIRPARIEDAPRIGEIHVAGWRTGYRGIIPDSFLAGLSSEKRAAGWKYAIEKDPESVLVAEEAGVIQGWAAIAKSREGIAGAGELLALYVDPLSWRKGYGAKLISAAEATLWLRGYEGCVLWVLERNFSARAFYRRSGYTDDGGVKSESIEGVDLVELRMYKRRANKPAQHNAGSRPVSSGSPESASPSLLGPRG